MASTLVPEDSRGRSGRPAVRRTVGEISELRAALDGVGSADNLEAQGLSRGGRRPRVFVFQDAMARGHGSLRTRVVQPTQAFFELRRVDASNSAASSEALLWQGGAWGRADWVELLKAMLVWGLGGQGGGGRLSECGNLNRP